MHEYKVDDTFSRNKINDEHELDMKPNHLNVIIKIFGDGHSDTTVTILTEIPVLHFNSM